MHNFFLFFLSIPVLLVKLHILAYIDPGTGSIILQALVASVVGAAIAVKLFWHRILRFLGLRKGIPPDPPKKSDNREQ